MNRSVAVVRGHKPDYVLALAIFVLLAFGLVIMYSISPVLSQKLLGSTSRNYYFYGQLVNVGAGLVAWLVATRVYYGHWKAWSKWLMFAALFALLCLFVPGLTFTTNGATRWLKLGPASFQPAELLKLASVLYLATWFERRGDGLRTFWDGLLPFTIMIAGLAVIVAILQKDLGTLLVLLAAAIGMYYVAGAKLQHLGMLLAGGAFFGWLLVVSFPHRLERLTVFLHPEDASSASGYHVDQALIAIGSGGVAGRGLGKSLQIYGYLPEAANDSIFAVIGEEVGFLGSVVLVGAFLLLMYRGFAIARATTDSFGRLVAIGVTLWLGSQAIINIAAMLSLIPLTGIPLPFISYGGSSLVLALFGAGILLNISKYTTSEVKRANSSERRWYSWPHNSNTSNSRRLKGAR
jgi:cell division protein FtsW